METARSVRSIVIVLESLFNNRCVLLASFIGSLSSNFTPCTQMSPNIPKTQKAAVVATSGSTIEVKNDHPVKSQADLAPGECLVKLHCTGVCHTDLHAALGDWPLAAKTPLIGGHEGVGDIVAIGSHTAGSPVKVGDRVGIKWLAGS